MRSDQGTPQIDQEPPEVDQATPDGDHGVSERDRGSVIGRDQSLTTVDVGVDRGQRSDMRME